MMLMIVRIICILTMVTRCMDINIMAAMEAAELVLDRMSLANGGKGGLLVNTASLAGFFHSWSTFANSSSYKGIVPGWVQNLHSYFASKHAVVSMTRTLGSDNVFKETGVKVRPVFSLNSSPISILSQGPVHLPLVCGHCYPGRRGAHGHVEEELRYPHGGGGLRGLHAVGRELWQWCRCHCLQGALLS